MQVRELMTNKVRAIKTDTTIRQAAKEMASTDVGVLPVSRDKKLVGMLTDRDITVRVIGQDKNPDDTSAEQVMTSDVFTVSEDQDVSIAGQAMRDKQIRRAPVVNKDGQLVGIVSLGDFAVKSGDTKLSGEVLKGVSQPSAPNLR